MTTRRTPTLAIGAAALLAWSVAGGQQPKPAAPSLAEQVATYTTDELKTELNLTDKQVPKVEGINKKTATEIGKVFRRYEADTSLAADKAFVRELLAALRANQVALKKVLTAEQWALHQQHKAQRLATNQTEVMTTDLSLSRAQILDVQRINLETANKLVSALEEPKGAAPYTRQQRMNAAKPALTERDAALQQVLTVEQWSKMLRKRRALHDLLVDQATVAVAKMPKS